MKKKLEQSIWLIQCRDWLYETKREGHLGEWIAGIGLGIFLVAWVVFMKTTT